MRTICASLRRPEFDITAAFLAGTADQKIAHAAFRKPGGVVLGGGSLRSRESGYTLLNRFHELGFVYILEQAAAAGLALHHSFIVSAATEQGGRIISALPSGTVTASVFMATLSGSSKVLSACTSSVSTRPSADFIPANAAAISTLKLSESEALDRVTNTSPSALTEADWLSEGTPSAALEF